MPLIIHLSIGLGHYTSTLPSTTFRKNRAVALAQLVEQSLSTPEIRGSKPVIGENLSTNLSTNRIIEKTKIKEKRPEPGLANL